MENPYSNVVDTKANVGFARRRVGSNELVRNQMNGLMNAGGQYLSNARTRGVNEGSKRGLLNSSLSAASGEGAAINAALPIASQDASTYRSAADMESGNEQQSTITGAQIAAQERASAESRASASAYAASASAAREEERKWNDARDIRNRGWSVEDRNFGRDANVQDRDAEYGFRNSDREANFGYGRENRDAGYNQFNMDREDNQANDQTVRNDNMFASFMQPFMNGAGSNPDFWANPEALGGFMEFISGSSRRAVSPSGPRPSLSP